MNANAIYLVILVILSCLTLSSSGDQIIHNLDVIKSTRKLSDNAAVLKISFSGFTGDVSKIEFTFSPPLKRGDDYEMIPPDHHKISPKFNYGSKQYQENIYFRLKISKRFIRFDLLLECVTT